MSNRSSAPGASDIVSIFTVRTIMVSTSPVAMAKLQERGILTMPDSLYRERRLRDFRDLMLDEI